jgi:hypothetical protein
MPGRRSGKRQAEVEQGPGAIGLSDRFHSNVVAHVDVFHTSLYVVHGNHKWGRYRVILCVRAPLSGSAAFRCSRRSLTVGFLSARLPYRRFRSGLAMTASASSLASSPL